MYYKVYVMFFSQAYCYIVSGGCFSIALRFAGSSNKSAYDLLVSESSKYSLLSFVKLALGRLTDS